MNNWWTSHEQVETIKSRASHKQAMCKSWSENPVLYNREEPKYRLKQYGVSVFKTLVCLIFRIYDIWYPILFCLYLGSLILLHKFVCTPDGPMDPSFQFKLKGEQKKTFQSFFYNNSVKFYSNSKILDIFE